MQYYYIKKFIDGENTIVIRNKKEFAMLEQILKPLGISLRFSYEEYKNLAVINHCKNPNIIILENQPGKGITFYRDIKNSVDWYGVEPFEASMIFKTERRN